MDSVVRDAAVEHTADTQARVLRKGLVIRHSGRPHDDNSEQRPGGALGRGDLPPPLQVPGPDGRGPGVPVGLHAGPGPVRAPLQRSRHRGFPDPDGRAGDPRVRRAGGGLVHRTPLGGERRNGLLALARLQGSQGGLVHDFDTRVRDLRAAARVLPHHGAPRVAPVRLADQPHLRGRGPPAGVHGAPEPGTLAQGAVGVAPGRGGRGSLRRVSVEEIRSRRPPTRK